ncbi:MAG: SDR family NAD(P)-dependent oxidoreductase [Bacteroidales bacterium]|nr:SDR family NAD(P)-dependent oxidoreductase [Bacteroidales bacterium]
MKEKVILITGASSGIGYDAVQMLSQQGHRVYAAARRVEKMEPLKAFGAKVLRMDVTDERSMQQGVDEIIRAEGRIDVLVNNAGYGFFGAIETVPMEEARRQLEVNVFGLARLTQLVLPQMRKQGSGRIINTASIAGKMVFYMGGWYNVTKYSVEAFSDALRMEMKPFGIDVVMIEPGAIKTDWGIIAAKHLKESAMGTAYEDSGTQWADNMDWFYRTNLLSSPSVIAKAMSRAVNSRQPKARYCLGRFSVSGRIAHTLMPARWWDAMMRQGGKIKVRGQRINQIV